MLVLFFIPLAIGCFTPLFRGSRGTVLALCAGAVIVVMGYSYAVSTTAAVGEAASVSNRHQAVYVIECEAAVLGLALLARRRKSSFWVAWALHLMLTILCATVVIWLEFFWHW